uniref:Uncharacterized protein n=1 Tax=Rhizophora mucronata TaxID=61149 RepID=A0A2P2Q7N8_RHIMU
MSECPGGILLPVMCLEC